MRPDRQTVLGFWEERGDVIDRAIARGCRAHSKEIGDWSPYEWEKSLEDMGSLSSSRDAFYDRPTIGVAYGLWYHARRVNPLVSEVERIVRWEADRGSRALTIVDLGSGTGATSWAVALVTWAIRQGGGTPPQVNVYEVESSTFMRQTSTALWGALGQEIGPVHELVRRHEEKVSWPEMKLDADEPTWLIASYLLDHTDRHRRDEITKSLCQVVDNCSAVGVIFTVSQNKREIAQEVIDQLETDYGWKPRQRRGRNLWSGSLIETSRARREIYSRQGLERHNFLAQDPSFIREMPSVLQATRSPGDEARLLPFPSSSRWPRLNEDQEGAARSDRSVLLQGAAGSGKSIVLVERLAKIIQRSRVGQPRSILVTSFNKDMIGLLTRWFTERMDDAGIRSFTRTASADGYSEFSNVGTGSDRVTFCNWDKAPTRLARLVPPGPIDDSVWLRRAASITKELLATNPDFRSIDTDNVAADPEFQLMELKRVVYGLMATTKDKYLEIERIGRGRGLRRRGPQRELVWSVIERAPSTYTHRRMHLLKEVLGGRMNGKFTDLFVDEAQDFLPADIECCYALRKGENPTFMVVDQTQALHTGSSYQSPKPPPGSRWERYELLGSYRLPVTVANCVRSLGESIQRSKEQAGLSTDDIALPSSRKASVVGVRPVVVVGDEVSLARSIKEIRSTYDGYLSAEDLLAESRRLTITICEVDHSLERALLYFGLQVETTTIKKIKGLERGFLVWSTRSDLGNPDESQESAYTIATRSSCILVIAVDPSKTPDQAVEILGELDREYLMFWNQASEDWWNQTVLN